MAERPRLHRIKKGIVALSHNLKLTAKERKFRLKTTGGLALLLFKRCCQMTIL